MEDKKLNGFNNGRDTTDGVGGRPPYLGIDDVPFEEAENSPKMTELEKLRADVDRLLAIVENLHNEIYFASTTSIEKNGKDKTKQLLKGRIDELEKRLYALEHPHIQGSMV